ncbi:MAG: hypothetical protein ACU0BG_02130 [Paracoccus sp. (in: a-proteobacteria)]
MGQLPWFTGEDVMDGDDIDVAACLRIIFLGTWSKDKSVSITVERAG